MFTRDVLPHVRAAAGGAVILSRTLHTFGLGESTVADLLKSHGDLMTRGRNPSVGTTVSDGIVSLRLNARFPAADEADRQLDRNRSRLPRRPRRPHLRPGRRHPPRRRRPDCSKDVRQDRHHRRDLHRRPGRQIPHRHPRLQRLLQAGLGHLLQRSQAVAARRPRRPARASRRRQRTRRPGDGRGRARRAPARTSPWPSPASPAPTAARRPSPSAPSASPWPLRGDTYVRTIVFPGDRDMVRDRSAKMALTFLRFRLLGRPLARSEEMRPRSRQVREDRREEEEGGTSREGAGIDTRAGPTNEDPSLSLSAGSSSLPFFACRVFATSRLHAPSSAARLAGPPQPSRRVWQRPVSFHRHLSRTAQNSALINSSIATHLTAISLPLPRIVLPARLLLMAVGKDRRRCGHGTGEYTNPGSRCCWPTSRRVGTRRCDSCSSRRACRPCRPAAAARR